MDELDARRMEEMLKNCSTALEALAQALVDCGALKAETLIEGLERQRARKHIRAMPGEPITGMIQALRLEMARRARP